MKYSQPIHLVGALRSPIGRFGGGLKSLSATELTLQVADALVSNEVRPAVGQVIVGQVLQAGSGMNVARQVGLRLGLSEQTTAFTVNMACASGLKSVALAADAIESGESALVLAGGVEVMSRAPHYDMDLRWGRKLGDSMLVDSLAADGLSDPVLKIGMGETAERIADRLQISRSEQDAYACESQARAAASCEAMRRELVEIRVDDAAVNGDEHLRPGTTMEKLAQLKPVFRKNGTVTAGNSSGMNDGAAMVLLAGDAAFGKHGLISRARIVGATAVGCDPGLMGLGPILAIRRLCEELAWDATEVEAIEINEAFAVQVLGCLRELKLDLGRVNRRGGAIALGHPVGCSGARVLVTLLHLMEDLQLRRGIASLCVGGGMGIAMAIEIPR